MGRFKRWLYNKFLPAWCKDDLMETNAHLVDVVSSQRQEIDRLKARISGMETAMRCQRRISIRNEVKKD